MLKSYLLVFFVSMVPLIELRGAIPIGLGMGRPMPSPMGMAPRSSMSGTMETKNTSR